MTPLRATCALIVLYLTVFASISASQTPSTTGQPSFGSFGGGPDVINLSNLNFHLTVPVLQKSGRNSLDFVYDLGYDSLVWVPTPSGSTTSWQPQTNWGWGNGSMNLITGYVFPSVIATGTCFGTNGKSQPGT